MIAISTKWLRGDSGLSRVDLALLAYVLENPVQGRRADIAEACGCAPNSIPRAAKKLVALGLLERAPGGGTKATQYSAGRNLYVTFDENTRNAEVTRNVEVTDNATSMLRAANSVQQSETTTTDMVVTEVTGTRNIPPHTPLYINSTLTGELNPEREVLGGEGGAGGDFTLEAPKPKRVQRRKAPKFVATDDTLPKEPTPEMSEIAAERGMVNGTRAEQFAQWRRWHIREGTVMTYPARSWQTWVNNWAERQGRKTTPAAKGVKFAGFGPNGEKLYNRDHSKNFYRG